MSVIGIDFGNESCYVAAAKAGGIETLANDYSLRATPSCVAFFGKKRIIGVAAKNQQVTNMKNTISGFKRLLGRKYNDPRVKVELSNIPCKVDQRADGGIGLHVNYLGQDQVFTPEQLTAMLFTKLKETSTHALQAQVNDCVIACPVYFTNAERKALLDAAAIAGLNVLRLMNETTATALSYGFYKQDLPSDKPRNVVFVDCGHSSLQVSVCAFTTGKLKMLASTWEQIGGRDFDYLLAEYFCYDFQTRYNINVKSNPRAYLRLLTEVEKIKKQMSANSTKLPLNIECFMNDIDVHSSIQRSTMEEICANLLHRVDATLKRCLQESKLSLDDIHSVEIVGGSTRIPSIKAFIEQAFGKPASTTLNQDESVSRGAALQCAIMSPAVRVREFSVTDIQNYAVKVIWEPEGSLTGGEIEVFPAFHAAPFSRMLTLNRKEPFNMIVQYAQPGPYPDPFIGKWFIKDVKPNEKGDLQEIKVKVRINNHGIVLIANAALVEKKEVDDIQPMVDEQQQSSGDQAQVPVNAESMETPTQEGTEKKKKTSKLIDLPMDVKTHGYSMSELNSFIQLESKMIANDAQETQRVDARNALEEFVYEMRNKLSGGPLERYVTESVRDTICAQLNDIESWLYEDGEDCERDEYISKLSKLQGQIDPIKERCKNYEEAPIAFDGLKKTIFFALNAVQEYRSGSPKYDHLTETEFLNVAESAEKADKWMSDAVEKFSQSPRTSDCPISVNEIRHQARTLHTCVNSVINRPKPKPPTPTTKSADAPQQSNGEADQDKKNNEESKTNINPADDPSMDVE